MKKIIAITLVFTSALATAQDAYTKGMKKAFDLWSEAKTMEASNLFERIATAEPDNWLPFYYVSYINTVVSFGEKDETKLTQQLEKAQEYIDLAQAISPENPEILVQQAMVHTAWVAFDGATYGMTLSGKVATLYARASELAPDNPRVIFNKAEWDMGSARYFGQDVAPYCKDVERAIELFDNFKAASEFHPNWGKKRAEATLIRCNQ